MPKLGERGFRKYTDDQLAEMKRLSDAGQSASEIARTMGFPGRNTVIGQLHRHFPDRQRLEPGRRPAVAKDRPIAETAKPTPKPTPPPPMPAALPEPDSATVVPLEFAAASHCRWPLWGELDGYARGFPVCGAATKYGESYCPDHQQRVFAAQQPRKSGSVSV